MDQTLLWHDSLAAALEAAVYAIGGPKVVASELWPSKSPQDAARQLHHCLNQDRAEKLSLDEIEWILQRARAAGCHVAMAYLAQRCGYADPQPVEPEDERALLQRQFIEAKDELARLVARMDQISRGRGD